MKRSIILGTALGAVLLSAFAGYQTGRRSTQDPSHASATKVATGADATPRDNRKVLYWKHPDGNSDFAPAPKQTQDGRNYIPVYDDEEKAIAGDQPKVPPAADRKIVHYRNPMGLPDISPVPKKDWMGMDYIPVYEGEEPDAVDNTVKVSLDKVQRAGVRSEEARLTSFSRPLRAPGVAKPDERTLRVVSLRADAFIEKLYVNETGRDVKAGEPLFQVYSPQILRALNDDKAGAFAGQISANQRLKILDIPDTVIDAARKAKEVAPSFDYPSPASGVIMEKMVIEGMMMKMGEPLYRLADLSSIWVVADVAEQDMGRVEIGDPATISFRALPGETFKGQVTLILHELDAITRTGHVRIEVENPNHRIKHEMYAEVVIDTGAGASEVLTVPTSALIDNGSRPIVLVERGEGRFEPRPVKVGRRGDGVIEISDGLKPGERVVVSANFLIDAESNLKAALSSFTADSPVKDAQPAGGTP